MKNSTTAYIEKYNKENYKMYQFRIRKSDEDIIKHLDSILKRNSYIVSLIKSDINAAILSIKEIKTIVKPILNKYGINEIYLFGSYARGEATANSDIDIYCEKGNINNYIDQGKVEEELVKALNKEVDMVFIGSSMNEYFKSQLMEDLIKLC